jgi:hypothetical protein
MQNYPNPFNPVTVINWQLAAGGRVELNIYNLLGQLVASPLSGWRNAGKHQVEWDASGFPSGVYYYILKAGDHQHVKKMILAK